MKKLIYTEKQKASLRRRAKKKGYKAQWRIGENINSRWQDWNRNFDFDFSVTHNCWNLYRVVKIK
jgi:hypothetical protein